MSFFLLLSLANFIRFPFFVFAFVISFAFQRCISQGPEWDAAERRACSSKQNRFPRAIFSNNALFQAGPCSPWDQTSGRG